MRFRLESLAHPGLVLADELTAGSDCVRGGKPVDGYPTARTLFPGQATLQVYALLSPDEGKREGVYAVRRMADDPARDATLVMPALPLNGAARGLLGDEHGAEPHQAPSAERAASADRRRRSQIGAPA